MRRTVDPSRMGAAVAWPQEGVWTSQLIPLEMGCLCPVGAGVQTLGMMSVEGDRATPTEEAKFPANRPCLRVPDPRSWFRYAVNQPNYLFSRSGTLSSSVSPSACQWSGADGVQDGFVGISCQPNSTAFLVNGIYAVCGRRFTWLINVRGWVYQIDSTMSSTCAGRLKQYFTRCTITKLSDRTRLHPPLTQFDSSDTEHHSDLVPEKHCSPGSQGALKVRFFQKSNVTLRGR